MKDVRRVVLTVLLIGCWSWQALAFQTAPVIDDCNRTETPLSSGWGSAIDPDHTIAMTANGTICRMASAGTASSYWTTLLVDNRRITADCPLCTGSGGNTVALYPTIFQPSASSQTVDGYRCTWAPAVTQVSIQKITNGGSGVNLGASPVTQVTSSGDKLGCEHQGDTISLWQDTGSGWTQIMSVVDTSFPSTTAYVGIHATSVNFNLDNIGVGGVTGTNRWAVPSGGSSVADCTSMSTPCTLTRALTMGGPGDTVILRDGVYTGMFTTAQSGTPSAYITIKAEHKHAAIIQVSTSTNITDIRHNYLVIQGLAFDGMGVAGVNGGIRIGHCVNGDYGTSGCEAPDVHHVTFEHNLVENLGYSGIHITANQNNLIIRHNIVRNPGLVAYWGECLYLGSKTDAVDTFRVYNVEVYGNEFDTCTENAMDIKEYADTMDIHHNVIHGQRPGVESGATDLGNPLTDKRGYKCQGSITVHGENIDVHDNIFYDNKPGWGALVIVPSSDVHAVDNVVYDELQPIDAAFPNTSQIRGLDFDFEHTPSGADSTVTGNTFCNMTTYAVDGATGLTVSSNPGIPGGVAQSSCDVEIARITNERSALSGAQYPMVSGAIFSTIPIIDTCNRVENPLASGWAGPFDPDSIVAMTANGTICVQSASGNASTYWNTAVGSASVITATCSDCTTTSTNAIQLIPWLQEPSAVSNTVDYYRCLWQPAASVLGISRVTNGATGVQLTGSPITNTVTTGAQLGCMKQGATISAWQNDGAGWYQVLSVTDTSPTFDSSGSGYAGFFTSSTTLSVDNLGIQTLGAQRQGLFHTAEEVAIWQARRTQAPYDAMWAYIVANADGWVASPDARFPGQTTNACWATANSPNRRLDDGMLDAAFVYLLTGTTSYLTPVVAQLMAQTAVAGTDFSNTTRWCAGVGGTPAMGTNIGPWIRRLVLAYDYVRSSMSASDIATMDAWFLKAGTFFDAHLQALLQKRFANRLTGDYSACNQTSFCPGNFRGLLYYGGPSGYSFHEGWNNQTTSSAATVAVIGVLLDNDTLIASAKRVVKEWIAYATFPGGHIVDEFRWYPGIAGGTEETPGHAYHYAAHSLGSIITIADVLARTGDRELWDYTTSAGMFGSEGGPKSLLAISQHFADITNETVSELACVTGDTTCAANLNNRIDSSDETTSTVRNEFIHLSQASLFTGDSTIKTAADRSLYASPASSGYDWEKGEWGVYPHNIFLFGGMEGIVWPYDLLTLEPPSVPLPGIILLPAPTQVGSLRQGGSLQGGARQ